MDSKPLTGFPQFSLLSTDIQMIIWDLACQIPRIVEVTSPPSEICLREQTQPIAHPALLRTSHQSRRSALKYYKRVHERFPIYVNPAVDTLYFGPRFFHHLLQPASSWSGRFHPPPPPSLQASEFRMWMDLTAYNHEIPCSRFAIHLSTWPFRTRGLARLISVSRAEHITLVQENLPILSSRLWDVRSERMQMRFNHVQNRLVRVALVPRMDATFLAVGPVGAQTTQVTLVSEERTMPVFRRVVEIRAIERVEKGGMTAARRRFVRRKTGDFEFNSKGGEGATNLWRPWKERML